MSVWSRRHDPDSGTGVEVPPRGSSTYVNGSGRSAIDLITTLDGVVVVVGGRGATNMCQLRLHDPFLCSGPFLCKTSRGRQEELRRRRPPLQRLQYGIGPILIRSPLP